MQPDPDLWPWGEGCGCTKNKTKKTIKISPKSSVKVSRGHRRGGGGGGGESLLAVMKERSSITGSGVLYERDREGFKDRAAIKEGQSERKRRQATTWKNSEVDTFTFSAFLHLQIFHILTAPPSYLIFSHFLLLKKFAMKGKYLCFALIPWQPVAGWGDVRPEPSSFP